MEREDGLRLAMLSLHGCPLDIPGMGETGGMQVYVRELGQELGRRGVRVDLFTPQHHPPAPKVEALGPGARVIHLGDGRFQVSKAHLPRLLPALIAEVIRFQEEDAARYDLVHSHYWLSAQAGLEVARRWGVPHIAMFHTLGPVKRRAGSEEPAGRIKAEREVGRPGPAHYSHHRGGEAAPGPLLRRCPLPGRGHPLWP